MGTGQILTSNGLKATSTGLAVELRLPWYRAMPLSVVDVRGLRVDGVEVPADRLLLEINGRDFAVGALGANEEVMWYVTDSAFLKAQGILSEKGRQHDIDVALAVKLPYAEGDFERLVHQNERLTVSSSGAGLRLGSTLYAYTNEFHSRQYSFEELVREVARRNLGPGLEIVGFQSIRGFPHVSDEFVARFRDLIAETGLEPSCLGTNADRGISRHRNRSDEELVETHAMQIRAAAKLGFPVARVQYIAGPAVIEAVAPLAEELGVRLALEIHAPHSVDHPDILAFREMYSRVNSPFLGFMPDFGASARNVPPSYLQFFRDQGVSQGLIARAMDLWHRDDIDRFEKIKIFPEIARMTGASDTHLQLVAMIFGLFSRQPPGDWLEIMPQVVHVHGKFFDIDESGEEVAVDYPSLLPIFVEGGFNGVMSSEWEGHMWSNEPGLDKVAMHQALCRKILGRIEA